MTMKPDIDKFADDIFAVLKKHRVQCNLEITFTHRPGEWVAISQDFVGKNEVDLLFKATLSRVPDEEPE